MAHDEGNKTMHGILTRHEVPRNIKPRTCTSPVRCVPLPPLLCSVCAEPSAALPIHAAQNAAKAGGKHMRKPILEVSVRGMQDKG